MPRRTLLHPHAVRLLLPVLLAVAACGAPTATLRDAPAGTFTALRSLDAPAQDAETPDVDDEEVVGPVRPPAAPLDLTPAPTPQRPTFSSNTMSSGPSSKSVAGVRSSAPCGPAGSCRWQYPIVRSLGPRDVPARRRVQTTGATLA